MNDEHAAALHFLLYSPLPNVVTLKTRHEKINNLMIDGLIACMSFFSYRGCLQKIARGVAGDA